MVSLSKLRASAPAQALRHRNFRLYATGNLVNLLGTRVHEIAAGWLVWTLTESATWLGILVVAEMVPRMLMWPFAGVLADRMDRRRMAFIFQAIAAASAGALALASALEVITVWMIVFVQGMLGLCLAFWQPARFSLLSQVVPKADMTPAVAITAVVSQSSRIAGPALAGVILVYSGTTAAFAWNAVTYLAVIVALSLMSLAPRERVAERTLGMAGEVMEGVRYIARHPGIGPVVVFVFIFSVAVRPIIELMPAFADAVFDRGAAGLSLLNTMIGVGAVAGAMFAAWRGGLKGLVRIMAVSAVTGGVATFLFAITGEFVLALACVALAGAGIVLHMIVSQTMVQAAVDDAIRGRVFSIYGVINGASPGLGTLAIGWAADQVGLLLPVAVGGGIGVVLGLFVLSRYRRLAAILESEAPAVSEAPAAARPT